MLQPLPGISVCSISLPCLPATGDLPKEVNTVRLSELSLPVQVWLVLKQQSSLASLDGIESWVVEDCEVPARLMVCYDRAPCAVVKDCLSKQHWT